MFKILRNKKDEKIIAVKMETGEIFEEIGEPEEVEIPKKTKKMKKKKRHYRKVAREEKARPEKPEKRWSRNYDKCQECGTDEVKHSGNGLCKNCYQSKIRGGKVKRHRDAKWSKKTYQTKNDKLEPPISSAAKSFMCNDCGHIFQSVMEEDEVLCPNCESEHCEIVK